MKTFIMFGLLIHLVVNRNKKVVEKKLFLYDCVFDVDRFFGTFWYSN